MKLAIMQPYFFPYLGYFQLINAVDKFVVHDDVQFIKGGWINKNKLLLKDSRLNIGIPIKKDSSKKKINERYYTDGFIKSKKKILRQIDNAYNKAPYFEEIFPIIKDLFFHNERSVSKYNTWLLSELCGLLKITTPFFLSSEIEKQEDVYGEERVISINHFFGSKVYINPPGGVKLYNRESFYKAGIELKFLITDPYCYKQFERTFVPDLSIIDVLMFNSPEAVIKLLDNYHLE